MMSSGSSQVNLSQLRAGSGQALGDLTQGRVTRGLTRPDPKPDPTRPDPFMTRPDGQPVLHCQLEYIVQDEYL